MGQDQGRAVARIRQDLHGCLRFARFDDAEVHLANLLAAAQATEAPALIDEYERWRLRFALLRL